LENKITGPESQDELTLTLKTTYFLEELMESPEPAVEDD
jgi:hypothetical protein